MKDCLENLKKSPITSLIIAICMVIYLISFFKFGYEMDVSEAIDFGAYNGLLVYYYNEYYRILSSNFIHFGAIHLFVNCYSLSGIGGFIERIFDKAEYAIILLCSALSTTGISYILFLLFKFEANTISGGISGVIFGVIGSLLALAIIYKDVFMKIFKSLIPNLAAMFLLSIVVKEISLFGHLFGMIGGFVSTYIILLIKIRKNKHMIN